MTPLNPKKGLMRSSRSRNLDLAGFKRCRFVLDLGVGEPVLLNGVFILERSPREDSINACCPAPPEFSPFVSINMRRKDLAKKKGGKTSRRTMLQ